MRISDWSSDVCSSDLQRAEPRHALLVGVGLEPELVRRDRLLDRPRGEEEPDVIGAAVGGRRGEARLGKDRTRVREGKSVSVREDPGGRRFSKTNNRTAMRPTRSDLDRKE